MVAVCISFVVVHCYAAWYMQRTLTRALPVPNFAWHAMRTSPFNSYKRRKKKCTSVLSHLHLAAITQEAAGGRLLWLYALEVV